MRRKTKLFLGTVAWLVAAVCAGAKAMQTCSLPKPVQDKFSQEIDSERIRCFCESSPIHLPQGRRVDLKQVMFCGEGEGTYHIGFFKGQVPVLGWLQVAKSGDGKIDLALRADGRENILSADSFLFMDEKKGLPGMPLFRHGEACFKARAKLVIREYFVKTQDGSGVSSDNNYITAFWIRELESYQPCGKGKP
ncbi:MAG: hypothetical protein EOP38_00990 [Rubrivivax sp.]|nr:MAG: hypothetical protein EOP38_00990 [Rubrivivax sp.]